MLTLGAGLAVGTLYGRARWLAIPALLLLPVTAVANAVTLPLSGGIGERRVSVESIADLQPAYHLAVGHLQLDLERLRMEPRDEPFVLDATVALGKITLSLPSDVPVDVRARIGIGELRMQGEDIGAIDVDVTRRFGPADVPPALVLDLQTSLGAISVWALIASDA